MGLMLRSYLCRLLAVSTACFASSAFAQSTGERHPERGGIGLESAFRQFGTRIAESQKLRDFSTFDAHKSIFVTDLATMSEISFAAVMAQLASQHGPASATTKEKLFEQWWDTQQQKKSGTTPGPHCDDEAAAGSDNLAKRNGFAYRCPRPEASQLDPFAAPAGPNGYTAIAYSNRFDLASSDGSDCGEYRVVFARNSGRQSGTNRNLIIFEARVPNPAPTPSPTPDNAHDGCRPILEFWASLSDPAMTTKERGIKLREFYLNGLPAAKVGAVINVENFTDSLGQIRTNQFMTQPLPRGGFEWSLREFRFDRTPTGLKIMPGTVKTNPGTDLFFAKSNDARAADFVAGTVGKLDDLRAKGDEASRLKFSFSNGDRFNSFESIESGDRTDLGDVLETFLRERDGALEKGLQQELAKAGSRLTPENIVRRIRTQTCAGCHEFSNNDANLGTSQPWPSSLGFVHQSELDKDLQSGPDGPRSRFGISPALDTLLIPARRRLILDYLSKFSS